MKRNNELLERVREMEDRYDAVSRAIAGMDEAGKIPEDVKRGVLSEDGLYDLLEDADRILAFAKEVLG